MPRTRSVLGFVALLTAVGIAIVIAAMALREPGSHVGSSTVLVYRVPSVIDEALPTRHALPFGLMLRPRATVEQTVSALDRAARDPRITSLVLHIESVDWGWGKLAEVRDAIVTFRDSGKPVYASFEGGGEAELFLASAATRLSMPPTVILNLDGLTASAMFLRGSLDKLDVRPNFAHAGRYKSAVETYTEGRMSGPAREALESLLDDTFALLTDTLASARGVSRDSLRSLIDGGPLMADAAVAAGLIDTVLYAADVDSLAEEETGDDGARTTLQRYVEGEAATARSIRIAYIGGSGTIVSGHSRQSPGEGEMLGAETMIEALGDARESDAIKAVVLRVDSPGGAVDAADAMWSEVRRCAAEKPVIVSMSDYAASGGYYIAAPAQRIVAQPGTITGSIGVFGGKFNVLGLVQKLGANVETVSRGRYAEMLSPFRDFDEDEARRYQAQVDAHYRTFLGRVSEGRNVTMAWADSVGQGRVWSGTSAYDLGLVDTLGGIPLAFRLALEEAELDPDTDYSVEILPRIERTFLDRLVEGWWAGDEDDDSARAEGVEALSPVIRAWLAAARFPNGSVMALLPWSIQIR